MKNYLLILFLLILASCSDKNDEMEEIIETKDSVSENVEVYNSDLFDESYVFGIKNGSEEAFLLNKQGDEIYNWNFDSSLGNDLEILPDGKLIGMFKSSTPLFSFGGYGGVIKILNIDGSTDWEYEYVSENYIAHHDVEMLSNGNVLFLAWEKITAAEAQTKGINTEVDIYPEALIEVNPTTNQIVWEWHSLDHLIQEENPSITSTYGVLNQNPQLINFNYNLSENGDIMHANGIDYDEIKDIIYVSVNFFSEVWVIDHSTSTIEAETSTGGNYNKGGDLIYRFGNPETYNNTQGQRLFFNNHFPNLLENDAPGKGNLLIFVNKYQNTEQSAVYELQMPDTFNLQSNNVNNEPEIVWSYTNSDMYSGRISGAVRLKNGNTLICEGGFGFWEITESGEIAWKYNGQGDSFWRAYSYEFDSPEVISLDL